MIRPDRRTFVKTVSLAAPTLLLVDVEGWSYEEAAEATEVPVGTVRSRLHRARIDVRLQLQPYLEEVRR